MTLLRSPTSFSQCHGEYHRSNVTQSQSLIVASFSPIHISDSEWLIAGYRSDFCSKTSNNLYVSFSAGCTGVATGARARILAASSHGATQLPPPSPRSLRLLRRRAQAERVPAVLPLRRRHLFLPGTAPAPASSSAGYARVCMSSSEFIASIS